ncbi:MAG: hypothetical protein U9R57_02570, partial [Thermodesulfobacteriota bacterium]|nr:hypothetical protein [Thermodesulfobacteriota bacterium]
MTFGLPREAHLLQPGLDAGRDQAGSSVVGASETVLLRHHRIGKYSASTPSSPDPAFSHMNQYSSQAGLSEPGVLSKHLQLMDCSTGFPSTRIFTRIGTLTLPHRRFEFPVNFQTRSITT